MSAPLRICELCGKQFDLHPKKPGLATQCPACTVGSAPLLPNQAREAHLQQRDENIEVLFRNAIKENDREAADKWDKLRKMPFIRTKNSN